MAPRYLIERLTSIFLERGYVRFAEETKGF